MTLRDPLTILAIISVALLPGALVVSLWGKRFRVDPLEYLFAALDPGRPHDRLAGAAPR